MTILNLQNKINGMKFATVLLSCWQGDKGDAQWSSGDVLYSINVETINKMGIPEDFYKDFMEQLGKIGSYKEIAAMFKVEPYSGIYQSPLVLRHKEIPQIIAHVIVQDRSWSDAVQSSNGPMHRYYDAELLLSCYVDVAHEGPQEYDEKEEYLKIFDALSSKGMNTDAEDLKD